MDHLGLKLLGNLEKIPYSDQCRYEPRVGFHAFPEKVGWKVNESHGCEDQGGINKSFEAFLQAWLFFGLLHTVLIDSDKNIDVYGTFVSNGRWISTENLEKSLERWKHHEEEQWERSRHDHHIREAYNMRMVRIQMALNRARGVVRRYCSLDGPEPHGNEYCYIPEERESFDLVSLSLIVLGETLSHAKVKIVEQVGFKIRGWHDEVAEGWGMSRYIKGKMQSEWCVKTLHVLEGQFRGNTTGLLAAYSLQPFRGQDHAQCTMDTCKRTSVEDSNKYEIRHYRFCEHQTGPDCGWGGTEPEDLRAIIKRGAIPLLLLHQHNNGRASSITVSLTDSLKCKEYATISHVWSDGYGNPKENKLRQCQLKFLKTALDSVDRGRYRNEKIAFWMDTLAIPVADGFEEERKIAIGRIHETFVRSRYTIVIDQGLCQEMSGEKYHEIAMRILASGWMRRLWTLQEAYLSERIFFKFQDDKALDLDDLEAMYPSANNTLNSCIPAIARSYFHSLLGTARRARIHDMTPKEGLSLIASVWKATQWRTTTHKQHEVLALATLFDLNTGRSKDAESLNQAFIAGNKDDESLDENMCTLLRLLEEVYPGSIPAGIIFLPGKRLSKKGYGWAPRTWISGQTVDYPDPLTIDTPTTRFVPGQGLHVEFPGFLLHSSPGTNPITHMSGNVFLRFPVDSTLTEWYEIKYADKEEKRDEPKYRNVQSNLTSRGYAIILPRQRPRDVEEIALLVETRAPVIQRSFDNKKETQIFHVSVLFRIRIKRVTKVDENDINKFYPRPKSATNEFSPAEDDDEDFISTQILGEALHHGQKWCVDQDHDVSTPLEDSSSESSTPGNKRVTKKNPNSLFAPITMKKMNDSSERGSMRSESSMLGNFFRRATDRL